jgi:hypothetical protein
MLHALRACCPTLLCVLAATRGDAGQHREAHYSRGIRQRLRKMSQHHKWKELYNVSINDMGSFMQDYSDMMARSLFCLVVPGGSCNTCMWRWYSPAI